MKICVKSLLLTVFASCMIVGLNSCDTKNSSDGDKPGKPSADGLVYSGDEIQEKVVDDHGNKAIRIDKDERISHPELIKNRENCFIVMSKKDYYLYVYEAQDADTVMLARYDCCFALNKGQKEKEGDMRTPHCTMDNPFIITQIADASTWEHDFGDGRGPIKSYGS